MEYPKIETLFVRDPVTHKVIPNELRLLEVALIKEWLVTEKIDGMNIRVAFHTGAAYYYEPKGDTIADVPVPEPYVTFYGRTEAAQLPKHLLAYLAETFTLAKIQGAFDSDTCGILYGEGYGEKIQGGGKYRQGVGFRLFDVVVFSYTGRPWWLEWENVESIAKKLDIKTTPVLGTFETRVDLVSAVAEGFDSAVATEEGGAAGTLVEGVVARTTPLLLRRDGSRLMWKLKTKDF